MNANLANELLGYPSDARLLIINADDFGMCHSNNDAISRTLLDGIVSSASLMATCPWAPHAIHFLQAHPEIPFGVNLTVICEFGNYRWGPMACRERVPSLVDESGHFFSYGRRDDLLARARLEDLETEFGAQIGAVLGAGLQPTHLDWHCLADGGREDVFDLTFRLAREHGLALRVHERVHAANCLRDGLPANDFDLIDSFGIPPREKPARYEQLLRNLPPGLTEWAVHPSLGNDESQALEPGNWQARRADFDFFMSQAARRIVEGEGINLLDYRALQEIWAR